MYYCVMFLQVFDNFSDDYIEPEEIDGVEIMCTKGSCSMCSLL